MIISADGKKKNDKEENHDREASVVVVMISAQELDTDTLLLPIISIIRPI